LYNSVKGGYMWQSVEDEDICSICGKRGANYWTALHALSRLNHYHKECVEGKMVKCGGCGKELPMSDMYISYWNAFEWRCESCEKGG